MPRLRFTVRQVMLAVLLVAGLLATFEAGRRWERERNVPPVSYWPMTVPAPRSPMLPGPTGPGPAPPAIQYDRPFFDVHVPGRQDGY